MTWRIVIVVTLMSIILPAAFIWLGWHHLIRNPPAVGRSHPRPPRRPPPPAQATVELQRPAGGRQLPEQLLCRCFDGGRRDRSGSAPRRCGLCGNYR